MKKVFIMIFVFAVILLSSISVSAITGEGTETNPFLIETEEDFLIIGDFPTMYYKLNNDITVNSVLGDFKGKLDGNGFNLTTKKDYVFSSNSGIITNMAINGGTLVTENAETGIIDNCSITEKYLVTTNNGIVQNCKSINYCLAVTNNKDITNCSSSGEAADISAGIVISNAGNIDKCSSTINISITEPDCSVGGIAKDNTGNIRESSYNGNIYESGNHTYNSNGMRYEESSYFGGISANNSGLIDRCYSAGKIQTSIKVTKLSSVACYINLYSAGISPKGYGNITNCYSSMQLCPFAGVYCSTSGSAAYLDINAYGIGNQSKIEHCYFVGLSEAQYKLGSSSLYGSLYDGKNYAVSGGSGDFTDSYYLSDSPATADTAYGTPKSSGAMKMKLCYTDWDFDTIWAIDSEINDGYPYLQWQYEEAEEPVILDYTINSVKIKNANDEELESIPETGSCYAEIDVIKNTDRNRKDYLIIASYNCDGTLLDFTYMKGLYSQNQEITFGTLLKRQGIKTIKVFVWDGISSMIPLSNSYVFE